MKNLIFALVAAACSAYAGLVDIDGNPVTTNTTLGSVDQESGTVGDLLDLRAVPEGEVRRVAREEAAQVVVDATNDVMRLMPSGTARMLPEYLWYLEFGDSYTNDASAFYDLIGGCSSVRDGMTYGRNYDWPYSEAADVVVAMREGPGRFGSIGVASLGTNLTERMIVSGRTNDLFRALPGMTLDGMNSEGVVCNVNVVKANGLESGVWPGHEINALGAIRWVLDNAPSAGFAASNLAAKVFIPASMVARGYSCHFMIADRAQTWVVEDGVAHLMPSGRAALTNFRLFDGDTISSDWTRVAGHDPFGSGIERYDYLMTNGVGVVKALEYCLFTHAYRPPAYDWLSEFTGGSHGYTLNDREGLYYNRIQAVDWFNRRTRGDGLTWQTVHSSVYDITNLTLSVAVQEGSVRYAFGIPGSGGSGKVKSVNGEIGDVVLTPEKVGALPADSEALVEDPAFSNAVHAVTTSEPEAREIISGWSENMTGFQKTALLKKLVDYIRAKERIPEDAP